MTVPLRHFLVASGFLLLGAALGVGDVLGLLPGDAALAHVHLLLAGWVCVTIMGAMTQFLPVWSGTRLHSRRLATVQLPLVGGGLLGFAAALLAGAPAWLAVFGTAMALGFWTFVYNVGRTLLTVSAHDVTERHFALALGFFLLVTGLGVLLAADLRWSVFAAIPVTRPSAVRAHATLAVFGAVLTTVLGALYQLVTMFTRTELHGVDVHLRRLEEGAYPAGVLLLAAGRLVDAALLARAGGVLVAAALLGFSVILARRLHETRVERTPMLSRYAVAAPAMALWALLALPAWLATPLASAATFGAPGAVHLLLLGVVGFVVLGTLYHAVPFIVWVHRYSDLLGHEPVPMVDDLYDDRLAAADFALLFAGSALLVAADWLVLPAALVALGGALVLFGGLVFLANLLLVVRVHSPHSLRGILLGGVAAATDGSAEAGDAAEGG